MWIVALALRRPYTFVVVALLILIPSPVVILRTPTDMALDGGWNRSNLAMVRTNFAAQPVSGR